MWDKNRAEQLVWYEEKPKKIPDFIWSRLSEETRTSVVEILNSSSKKAARAQYFVDEVWGQPYGLDAKWKQEKWRIASIDVEIANLIGREFIIFSDVDIHEILSLWSRKKKRKEGIDIDTFEKFWEIKDIEYDGWYEEVETDEFDFSIKIWKDENSGKWEPLKKKKVKKNVKQDKVSFVYISPNWEETKVSNIKLSEFSTLFSAAIKSKPKLNIVEKIN